MFQLAATASQRTLRVLCLGAHSDDIEIGCGGTLLSLFRSQSAAVQWVVFSASEERRREAEQSAASFLERAIEKQVSVLNFRDGFFPMQADRIKEEFERIKREFTPDVIFTHAREDRHQDHRVLSDLAWNTFRDHLVLEYEIPKYDGDLGQPNLFVPISEEVCREKIEKLLAGFPSQRSKQWFDDETFRALLRLRGMEANARSRYAEAFYARKVSMAFPLSGASS